MSKTQTPEPHLAGAVLCGAAALLVLLCSLHIILLIFAGMGLVAARKGEE